MKHPYQTPSCEEIHLQIQGIIAQSRTTTGGADGEDIGWYSSTENVLFNLL